ncbi:MAG: hypothetical protein, partial [Olavius algarvensis Gamma 1 endosymbiont]
VSIENPRETVFSLRRRFLFIRPTPLGYRFAEYCEYVTKARVSSPTSVRLHPKPFFPMSHELL